MKTEKEIFRFLHNEQARETVNREHRKREYRYSYVKYAPGENTLAIYCINNSDLIPEYAIIIDYTDIYNGYAGEKIKSAKVTIVNTFTGVEKAHFTIDTLHPGDNTIESILELLDFMYIEL